jgi:single-strand DNA-binding protein
MMAGLNKCMFIGNLGKDPEIKYTPAGKAVVNFDIAVTEKWKDKENVEWIRVVVWEKLAEICNEYLKKGDSVYIEGPMRTRSWEDKNGNKRYTTEIIARQMLMLGGKGKKKEDAPGEKSGGETEFTDDIPF